MIVRKVFWKTTLKIVKAKRAWSQTNQKIQACSAYFKAMEILIKTYRVKT